MAYIAQRTFGTEGMRPCVGILNEEIRRKMAWGNSWTSIRVGMRLAVMPNAGANFNVQFHVGVCSGLEPREGFLSPYTKSALVYNVNNSNPDGTRTWIYTTPNPAYYSGDRGQMVWHYGGSSRVSVAGYVDGGIWYIPTVYGGTARRAQVYIEIRKPGTLGGDATRYAMNTWGPNSAAADMTDNNYISNLMSWGGTVYGSQSSVYSSFAYATAPVSETVAPLDTVTVSWQCDAPSAMEIYDLDIINRVGYP